MRALLFLKPRRHISEWTSSRCLISDPPRIQEPGGRRELAALLRPVPHAAEGTAGHVLRGVTVPQRQRLRREVGTPPTPLRSPTSTFHCRFHQKCFRSRCIKDFLLPCRSVITRDNIGNLLLPREHVTLYKGGRDRVRTPSRPGGDGVGGKW